jgi:hypothetical protein
MGVEPVTSCLPNSPAHRRRATHGRAPESRTPRFLLPMQARSPCRSHPKGPGRCRGVYHAVRCGVLKVQSPAHGRVAWVVGLEPTTSGFGDRCATRCTSPILVADTRKPPDPWSGWAARGLRFGRFPLTLTRLPLLIRTERAQGRIAGRHESAGVAWRPPLRHGYNGSAVAVQVATAYCGLSRRDA